jgi:hypothetical protein
VGVGQGSGWQVEGGGPCRAGVGGGVCVEGGRSWAPGPCRPPKPGGLLEKCREEEGSWCSCSGREAEGPSGQAKSGVWDVYRPPPTPPPAVRRAAGLWAALEAVF